MFFHEIRWRCTFDSHRGFGILFGCEGEDQFKQCFFEDGTLQSGKGLPVFDPLIDELKRYELDRWNYSWTRAMQEEMERQKPQAVCSFSLTKAPSLCADLTLQKGKIQVTVSKSKSYYYVTDCSCSGKTCIHKRMAAEFLSARLRALQRAYILSELPVDKSLFLDPELWSLMASYSSSGDIDSSMIQAVHRMVQLVISAKSEEYYWNFHRSILNLSPGYEYDAHFLEVFFAEPLMGLFEDPGYQRAVLSTGTYADPEDYEGRQHRSNRTCLKRILKDYQKAVKSLEKGDYSEDYDKEFLLKYRSDWSGLLRYYAQGKERLEAFDLPFLESISHLAGSDPSSVALVAQKIDRMPDPQSKAPVLRHLLEHLAQDEIVGIYAQLHNLSMSPEEIKQMGREDQIKMIRNTPVTLESFCYIMDDLIADQDPAVRTGYVLHVLERIRHSRDASLKQAVIERTARIPDSRLLLEYARYVLETKTRAASDKGDPEKELSTGFSCEYKIVRQPKSLNVQYAVVDPETRAILLHVTEENGTLQQTPAYFNSLGYSPEMIRKVCLRGKEEQFRKEYEQQQDQLDTDLFEKNNKQFAHDYKQLCSTLSDEKILYAADSKAHIEWLFSRYKDTTLLAFRVGISRMYVVKDAIEFLHAFRSGTTTEYGRDLILTHDPENLSEDDAPVMKMLMTAKVSTVHKSISGYKRYVAISAPLLANLLEALSGRTVIYNETACTIRLAPQKIRLSVSNQYTLASSLDPSHQEFLNLAGKGYLLITDQKTGKAFLDRVEGPAEEINLISLVNENPGVSIKPILKDFRKNIYSRFFELFDVDKAVEHDFTLSQIRLNTYFDFEKGVITSRTAVLRDGKEIRPETLTDRIDLAKIELLNTYLQNLGFEDGKLEDESRVLAFFKMDFTRLKTLTNVYLSENLQNKELKSIGKPVIRVTYQNNLVQVFLEKSDFSESELEQIISGLRKKRKYILLSGERIVDLDSEAAKDFGETVKDFEMDPKDLYQKKTVSMINAIKAFSHERSCRVDQYLRDMIEEIRSFKEAEITPPALNAELRDYQVEGFRWLSILTKYGMGGILADDMGLGKTIQMIALIKSDPTRKPSLVVCPKSLVFNWISEFARFDGETAVTAIYGLDSRRTEIISSIREDEKAVYITSYDSLRNDISKYTCEFNYVVLDEAQYIKNVNALKTRSVKELKACHRFAMTGTPIENSVIDLWSIFDFIMPGYFEELSRFREADTAVIARKAAPFILRRVKEDVLEDLPPKYERILSADMSDRQRKVYDAMRMDARKALEAGGKAFDMLPYLTRLRQVCVDPGMFVEGYQGGSGKLDMLSTLIPQYLAADHRILIFSQFVKALESVERMLQEKGIPTYFLSGETPAKDRVEMMDSFNNGSGTNVFLISLKAGGTGLNLTGADTVIHLDPWWNVAAENQASDRTHRIGQVRNVEVIKLIASDSIEQRVVELQDLKKEVIRQVISDDDGSVTSASLEDIAFVLD